jgi:D-alanyl-D-alanine carboxypeptidase (penicillin-binding protein 5/6)
MKRIICFVTAIVLMLSASTVFSKAEIKNRAEVISYAPASTADLDLPVKGACLIEASSGTVLYADDEHYSASPASVTKVMSLLLVAEALEAGCFTLTDNVTVSAYAASMGGSQVFLEEGESMTVEELIKCMVIASANDATVAMAELVAGSESEFVRRMNARAEELGLENTSFENTTGLDDEKSAERTTASFKLPPPFPRISSTRPLTSSALNSAIYFATSCAQLRKPSSSGFLSMVP